MKCLLLATVSLAFAGIISPLTSTPISLESNNSGETTDYTFTFNVQSSVPTGGIFTVEFPANNYASGLGITICAATDGSGNPYSCTVTATSVSVSIGQVSNAPSNNVNTVIILGVLNPSLIGVTGMFHLTTSTGINIIDYNYAFGQIGFIDAVPTLSAVSVQCGGVCLAGSTNTYTVGFTVSKTIPQAAKITITAPTSLTFPTPTVCTCTLEPTLVCTTGTNNVIVLTQVTNPMLVGVPVSIVFPNVLNPGLTGSVGTFSILAVDPLLNNLLINTSGIPGPVLLSNVVSTPTICPNNAAPCSPTENYVSISNRMFFSVTFTITNKVPSNGGFVIVFPGAFGTMESGTCQLLTGFTNLGYTESTQALCTVTDATKTLTVTNVGVMNPGICSLGVIATAPSAAGAYSPFLITSYSDTALTQVIDTVSGGSVSVANMYAMSKWIVTWGSPLVAGGTSTMTVLLRPYTTIGTPATSAIIMRFPTAFGLTAAPTPLWTPHNFFWPQALAATFAGGLFTFPLLAGPASIPNNWDSFLDVTNGGNTIILPTTPGNYAIQMVVNNNGVDVDAFQYWMTVLAAPFSGGSVVNYSMDINKNTVYAVSFTPTINIPSGSVPQLLTTPWGMIDIQFPTQNANWQSLWRTDLGTGLSSGSALACKGIVNMTPSTGTDVLCYLLPAASVGLSTYATVRIYNFNFLPIQVPVTLHIANICNAQTSGITATITVVTYTITQRIFTPLNQQTFTLPNNFYYSNSASLPIYNGRSPAPKGDGVNVVTFSPPNVAVTTNMNFLYWPEYNMPVGLGNAFFLKFPTTYPLPSAGVTCFINYSNSNPCYTYPVSGWLLIIVQTPSLTQHIQYTVTVSGLLNPPSQIPTSALSMTVIRTNIEIEYVGFQNFPTLVPGAITPVSLTADNYSANNIDTAYTFIFTLKHSVAVGGSVVFTFPKKNYVLTTFPTLQCKVAQGLIALTSGFQCTVASSAVTLTNFAQYTGGTQISVNILHVLNPSTPGTTLPFTIDSYSPAGYVQDETTSIPGVVIGAGVGVGKVIHVSFGATPNNGNLVATLSMAFLPSRTYPAGTVLQVTLPSETAALSVTPNCILSGGLTTLSSCSALDTHVLSAVTDSTFASVPAATPITVSILNMKNFQPGLTSGLVSIAVTFSNMLIDESPDDEANRSFTTGIAVGNMTAFGVMHYPLTAAEQATYVFKIQPSTAFTSNCTVNIQFPRSVPRGLNTWLTCSSLELSNSTDHLMDCYATDWTLTINGTWGFTPPGTFNVTVARVINPNPSQYLDVWIMYTQCGETVLDYTSLTTNEAVSQFPQYLQYDLYYSSLLYEGFVPQVFLSALSNINFATTANDLIFIDFPPVYDLTYTGSGIAINTNATATPLVSTTYLDNRVTAQAFDNSSGLMSNFSVTVLNAPNPYVIGQVPYLTMGVYQASTMFVLAKTVPNLALVPAFTLTKTGQDITINGNQGWSQNVGTRSNPITILLDLPATSGFTVIPTLSKGISVYPSVISFSVGDYFQTFQVSVGITAATGVSVITWTINGNWTTPFYTPIRATAFSITNNMDEVISVLNVGSVALGGRSPLITVSLSHAPDNFLVISIVKLGASPSEVQFNPDRLQFNGGVSSMTFDISVNSTSSGVNGEFLLYKSGEDQNSYVLLASVFSYDVVQPSAVPPIVISTTLTAVTRTSASFSMITNEPCILYTMVAFYGTRAPTRLEATSGQLNNTSTILGVPMFNTTSAYVQLTSTRYQFTFTQTNLTAQTNYVLQVFVVDLGGIAAQTTPNVNFTTSARLTPVYFNLTFTVDPSSMSTLITNSIASILQISVSLIDILHDLSFLPRTGVKIFIPVYHVTVAIWSDPTSPSNVTPAQYAAMLQTQMSMLHQLIPTYDMSSAFSIQQLTGVAPVLQSAPSVQVKLPNTISVTGLVLINNGVFFFCLVPSNVTPVTPTSYQIVNGVDSQNVLCNSTMQVQVNGTIAKSVEITGLQGGVNYWVYISASNTFPRYPNILSDKSVITVSAKVISSQSSSSAIDLVLAILCLCVTSLV